MLDESLQEVVKDARLRYLSDNIDGIKRFPAGKDNFKYLDPDGEKITDQKTLERIKDLSIPPAWENVWISPIANSHLQATGFDEKKRKQYLYHQKWIEISQQNKFDKMIFFGSVLPTIRRHLYRDMKKNGLDKTKVLATVVWLLEHTFIRVGNEEYSRANKSFGLTTLRNRHVQVKGSNIRFQFKGKSGVTHLVEVDNPRVAKVIKKCIELPGFELFQYIDKNSQMQLIDSEDVNEYLKEITGEEISAKDFRTWGGSVLSATTLYDLGEFDSEDLAKKNITQTVKVVAKHLRNTPTVCREYYIHPIVISTYRQKILVPFFNKISSNEISGLTLDEYKLINLLQKYPL